MKTRKSILCKDVPEKEVLGGAVSDRTDSPSIVRKLRSRVITSDTDDDIPVRTRTPKSSRKAVKENSVTSPSLDNNDVSVKLKSNVGMETRTPKQMKRLSSVNLFRIEEVKEDLNAEECKGTVKEEVVENEYDEITSNGNDDSCSVSSHVFESNKEREVSSNMRVTTDTSVSSGAEEDTLNVQGLREVIKKENGPGEELEEEDIKNLMEDGPFEGELDGDVGSGDDTPEAVSFSSSKNMIGTELALISEAIRRDKEKRKDIARKRIEMIRIQKAEKEERRQQKMKFLEINIPERLAEEVTSSLPDIPDIPTVKKSESGIKKRKNSRKEEKLEHTMGERKNKICKFDDYIPITGLPGSTKFGVVPLEVAARLPKPSSQSAAEFKQRALYGSRIQREPSKNLLIYRQKLSAAGRLEKSYKSSSFLKM